MPFPRRLTVSGGAKANKHKVSSPRKVTTSSPKRCPSRGHWTINGKKIQCVHQKGHTGSHFNSFGMRSWD
jgi:hypothetical protein